MGGSRYVCDVGRVKVKMNIEKGHGRIRGARCIDSGPCGSLLCIVYIV